MNYTCLMLGSLLAAMSVGCQRYVDAIEDVVPDSTTDGPFEAKVDLAAGLDPPRVRAGLFRVDGPAELELLDGTRVDGSASIDILVSREGKAKLYGARDADGGHDPETFAAVRFEPLSDATLEGSSLTLELPEEPMADDFFRVIVWYDEDADGRLELGSSADSEYARSLTRPFPDDGQGVLHLFSVQSWPPDDDQPSTWKATAYGWESGEQGEDVYISNDISDRELGEWSVSIEAARE